MTHYKSKTLATWIALLGGGLGLHRFYLHGMRDPWGWLWPIATSLGVYGVQRVLAFGQDDQLSWVLLPVLGVSLSSAMLAAIIYGLTADEKWNAHFNPGHRPLEAGWTVVLGVVASLLIGSTVLMATIAFSGQRYFEYQVEEARKISQ